MALTDDNSMVMPVTPMYGGGGGNGGFGNMGGDWGWIILLLLLAGNGWGGGFGGGFGGGGGALAADGAMLYPWMNQSLSLAPKDMYITRMRQGFLFSEAVQVTALLDIK